jgi:phosphoribosylglycinamide formyltransferase-1
MKRIAVLASGGGTNLQAVIDACERGDIRGEVALVIYNRKAAFARERAQKHNIPAVYLNGKQFETPEAMDEAMCKLLNEYQADIVVLAGYLSAIGPKTVQAYRGRIINTHPALIPAFCGKGFYGHHVHEAVIAYGARVSGCTIHFVDEHMDTGPIIFQEAVAVLPDDTPDTLAARVLKIEHKLLPRAVALLCEDKIQIDGRKVTITE